MKIDNQIYKILSLRNKRLRDKKEVEAYMMATLNNGTGTYGIICPKNKKIEPFMVCNN